MLAAHSTTPVIVFQENRLITGSQKDGIISWSFFGDLATDYNPKSDPK